MSLIERPIVDPLVALNVRIKKSVFTEMESYCRFLGCKPAHYVENAISYIAGKDKEYQEWKGNGAH